MPRIDSEQTFTEFLANTALKQYQFESIPIPESDEIVFASQVPTTEAIASWTAARALLNDTGRWPLLVTAWNQHSASLADALEEEVLSRFPFENFEVHTPSDIIAASKEVDANSILAGIANDWSEDEGDLAFEMQRCEEIVGRQPEPADLDGDIPVLSHRVDRWIYDQELASGKTPDPQVGQQPWIDPESVYLLFMPVANGWETLAYASWFGAEELGASNIMALGKVWEREFGAELVANYTTMLHCQVSKPPTDPHQAWQLAVAHDLIAPSTLAGPGIAVYEHARGLINHERWLLHERP